MEGTKAPGLDGYTGLFYQHCWEVIKVDLLAVCAQFHVLAYNALHTLNDVTLVLLPKCADASDPNDFCPISLICSVAKLILQVLTP